MSNQLQIEMSPDRHTLNELIASNARVAFDTGAKTERQRIIKDLESVCRCNGKQTEGYYCEADWAIKIVNEYWKGEQK